MGKSQTEEGYEVCTAAQLLGPFSKTALATRVWKRSERGKRYRASPRCWLVHADVWSSEALLSHTTDPRQKGSR